MQAAAGVGHGAVGVGAVVVFSGAETCGLSVEGHRCSHNAVAGLFLAHIAPAVALTTCPVSGWSWLFFVDEWMHVLLAGSATRGCCRLNVRDSAVCRGMRCGDVAVCVLQRLERS